MAFPYAGTTGIASVLYDQCSHLVSKYFNGAVGAPANYRCLWDEVQQLSKTLKILYNYNTGEKRVYDAYQAAQESIEDLERFLKHHEGIKDADSKWWKEFSNKLHYVSESKQIDIFRGKFSSHVKMLEVLRSDMQLKSVERIEKTTTLTNTNTEQISKKLDEIYKIIRENHPQQITEENISTKHDARIVPEVKPEPLPSISSEAAKGAITREPPPVSHTQADLATTYSGRSPGAGSTVRERQGLDSDSSSLYSLPGPAPSLIFSEPESLVTQTGSDHGREPSIGEDEGFEDGNGPNPGEKELIGDRMRNINLQYANRLDPIQWENCQLRIFEGSRGQLRLRTIFARNFLDTYVTRDETEIVPLYSHFASPLILYLRQTGSSRSRSPEPSIEIEEEELMGFDESPYFKFRYLLDLLDVQSALLRETVRIDVPRTRLVKYKLTKGGEVHYVHPARLQIWRPQQVAPGPPNPRNRKLSQDEIDRALQIQSGRAEILRIQTSRVVIMCSDMILTFLITDAIDIKSIDNTSLHLYPYRSYTSIKKGRNIKAKTIFGISLRGAGITPDDEENFDDLRYIDIEFDVVNDKSLFVEKYKQEVNLRRRSRQYSSDLVRRSTGGEIATSELIRKYK